MPVRKLDPKSLAGKLRAHALALPETVEDFPWGERAIKVKTRAFVFAAWIEESFRAVAPKRVAAALDASAKRAR